MSKYIGDYGKNDTITFMFTTFRPSTGAPFALAGTPVVSVYKDNNLTQDTAGVTLTTNYDGVTGLNFVSIATTGAFYVDGSSYECVITTGTVDSVSVVGSCVGRFTMRDQACLYPTTHATTLDVSAAGNAGIDWANVSSPTTTLNLSATTISTGQTITSVSGSVGSVTGNVSGNVTGSVGSVTGNVSGNVTGSVGSVASGGITSGSFAAGAINAAAIATDAIGSDELAATATAEIADAILARKLDSTGNETSTTTANERTVRSALRYLRNKIDISASTMTVTTEDDTTTAWTAALTTTAGLNPVTMIDPT
jgi:hypothetical protein